MSQSYEKPCKVCGKALREHTIIELYGCRSMIQEEINTRKKFMEENK